MSNPYLPPPPPSTPLNSLAAVSNNFRKEVVGQWFHDASITLDGYTFINCRFDNCHITVSSPHFKLVSCWLDSGSAVFYKGGTPTIIQLFTRDFGLSGKEWEGFVPTRNPNGTITVGQ